MSTGLDKVMRKKKAVNGGAASPSSASGKMPKTYRCRMCPDFVATTKDEYSDHQRALHIEPEKLLTCPLENGCRFVTQYKHHLEYHVLNHSGRKPFQCPHSDCQYTCVNRSMLNSHLKSHSHVVDYQCQCGYQTKYRHSFKLHLAKGPDHFAVKQTRRRGDCSMNAAVQENDVIDTTEAGLQAVAEKDWMLEEMVAEQVPRKRRNQKRSGPTADIAAMDLDKSAEQGSLAFQQFLQDDIVEALVELPKKRAYQRRKTSPTSIADILNLSVISGGDLPTDKPTEDVMEPRKKRRYQRRTVQIPNALDLSASHLPASLPASTTAPTARKPRRSRQEMNLSQNVPAKRRARKTAPFKVDLASAAFPEEDDTEPLEALLTIQPASPLEVFVANSAKIAAESSHMWCPYCGVGFGEETMYQLHMGFHWSHEEPFKCICGQVTRDHVAFFLHIAQAPHF